MAMVRLGVDAFLDEKGARENALIQWAEHAAKSAEIARRATEGLIRVQKGELQVHMTPSSRVSTLAVFETTPFEKSEGTIPKTAPSSLVKKKFSW